MAQPESDETQLQIETPTRPEHLGAIEFRRARKEAIDNLILKLEKLARRCLHVHPGADVLVEYLDHGARLNPITSKTSFRVTVLDNQYHFAVKHNTGAGHEIPTQIAAMDCIRQRTDVFAVPKVIAHDVSDENEMGRAWIAREYIPGEKLCDRWKALSMQQKESITQDLARYLSQLYRIRFDKIGRLAYEDSSVDCVPASSWCSTWWSWASNLDSSGWLWSWLLWIWFSIYNVVIPFRQRTASQSHSHQIVVGKDPTIHHPGLPTGPFTNARDWFRALIQQTEQTRLTYAEVGGYSVGEEIRYISECIKWSNFIRQRPGLRKREKFTTIHHPIKESSILISDDGKLAGLLD